MSNPEIADCLGTPICEGAQVAAATVAYKSAHLRVGRVEKIHANGSFTLRLRDGTASVVRSGGNAVVVQGFGLDGRA